MAALQVGATLIATYWLYAVFRIIQNYIKARKCGFPIFITPVDQTSPFWLIFSPLVLPICKRLLPCAIWRPLDLSTYGFEWRDFVSGRTRPPAWMLIGPGKIDLFVEDAEIANTILSKRKQYPQEETAMKFLGIVGTNLTSSEGEDWQRQRRLIAPMLNERIMDTVWEEGRAQARDMLSSFVKDGGTTNGTIEGLRRIAFNVLQCIAYGMPQGWSENVREVPKGHKMAYMEALHEIIDGFILIAVVRSVKVLTMPLMPNVVKRKGYAMQDFLVYTQELLEKEREAGIESDKPRNSLLSLFSTISEESAKDKLTGVPPTEKQVLTDDEITGNLYQFTLAGFDTTANTLAYAVTTLAAVPEWQEWIIDEIDHVQKSLGDAQAGYPEIFPRLERCLALMYETLRMFTPVAHVVRECINDQVVRSGEQTYRIPSRIRATCVLQGIHEQKNIWGQDGADFRPTRWIKSAGAGRTSTTRVVQTPVPQAPSLPPPMNGAFMPWSAGPRICPGMKMAQVEFLSVIWTVFKEYRVCATQLDGESQKEAEQRLQNVMLNSEPRITLQMKKPQDVVMSWTKRENMVF